jgi:hypothetical protein
MMLFFADYYGWKYITLLKFKNYIETNSKAALTLIILSAITLLLNTFFPISPGPILLGELFVQIALLFLSVYTLNLYIHQKQSGSHIEDSIQLEKEKGKVKGTSSYVVERTHTLIETHKRNIGVFIALITALHLLYPQGILI